MAKEKLSSSIINTYFKSINLEGGGSKSGLMLVLDATFPDGHPLAGKPVCKFVDADFDLKQTGKQGWTVEFTKDGAYVNAPLIDLFDLRSHDINLKMDRAIDAGLEVHV